MSEGGELVATDEPTVVTETLLNAIVVEDCQSDGRFADPPCADESDWVRLSARPTIFSISSSRPQQALGGGGGGSPDMLRANVRD